MIGNVHTQTRNDAVLEYLIKEGRLPPQPSANLYTRHIYDDLPDDTREEVLWTRNTVIYSKDGFIQRVWTYQESKEPVECVLITTFDKQDSNTIYTESQNEVNSEHVKLSVFRSFGEGSFGRVSRKRVGHHPVQNAANLALSGKDGRAVVIFTKKLCYIHYLSGSTFIVGFSFDVKYAFRMPGGILVQRTGRGDTIGQDISLNEISTVSGSSVYNANWATLPSENSLPPFYILTDPLSEFTPLPIASLTAASQTLGSSETFIDYSDAQETEEIVYVSQVDECSKSPDRSMLSSKEDQLLLVVTQDLLSERITVWQVWRIKKPRLSSLLRHRKNITRDETSSQAMLQPRNSSGHTPSSRSRDRVRESLVAAALPLDTNIPRHQQKTNGLPMGRIKGKAWDNNQEKRLDNEEEALVAQLDPESRTSRRSHRYQRITGSLLSRNDLGPIETTRSSRAVNHPSQDRKRQSFRVSHGRQSLAASLHRKSMAFQTSDFGRSLGSETAYSMDLDESNQSEMQSELENAYTLFQATQNLAGPDFSLSSTTHAPKPEYVLRKVHDCQLPSMLDIAGKDVRGTLRVSVKYRPDTKATITSEAGNSQLNILLHDARTKLEVDLQFHIRPSIILPPSDFDSAKVLPCLPVFIAENRRHSRDRKDAVEADLLKCATKPSLQTSNDCSLIDQLKRIFLLTIDQPFHTLVHEIWKNSLSLPKTGVQLSTLQHKLLAFITMVMSFVVGSLNQTTFDPSRSSSKIQDMIHSNAFLPERDLGRTRRKILRSRAWQHLAQHDVTNVSPRRNRRSATGHGANGRNLSKISFSDVEAQARSILHDLATKGDGRLLEYGTWQDRHRMVKALMSALQLLREELKLSRSNDPDTEAFLSITAAAMAQIGHYLDLKEWDWQCENDYAMEYLGHDWDFSYSRANTSETASTNDCSDNRPFSTAQWLVRSFRNGHFETFFSVSTSVSTQNLRKELPHLSKIEQICHSLFTSNENRHQIVQLMAAIDIDQHQLNNMPTAIATRLRECIAQCQSHPPPTWTNKELDLIGRDDLCRERTKSDSTQAQSLVRALLPHDADLVHITGLAEKGLPHARSQEAERHALTVQIFPDDRRYVDALRMINPAALQVAECIPVQTWSEAEYLEEQKKVMQWVMTRTTALPLGNAMAHYESHSPLLSEKFHVPGFSLHCQMKPMDNIIGADRAGFSEEKLSWAFFHAGVSSGLHISRHACGIDNSWIMFSKPETSTNRHAGFLFALGLNGHLKAMAKWLAFKYLTPKHTMTSIGLLLGLAVSYMGSMDSLITRMLSVHVTRSLPAGAAELNVSPLTQTAGLLAMGLIYSGTQHRRMSEIMLTEMEYRDNEESGAVAESLHDESYRLAAGFALGWINLGKGSHLHGLQGMSLNERLLSLAVGPRPVEFVHVIDKAAAASVMAITMIYMKTNDAIIARKIDVPDTLSQLEHVRPDILLLRTLARNLIMWDQVKDTKGWIRDQTPIYFAHCFSDKNLFGTSLTSKDIPLYNILTGNAWALSLKYAGTGSTSARDEILSYLDILWHVSRQSALFYDAKLARTTVSRCIDVLALSAATVMAGTGDLITFRHLRRLHGRTDAETSYGSHMATHLAIGALFLGGGAYTFSTSNKAIAGLLMAFYPLWPSDVSDNAVHLQAFRHLWVLSAEARCVIVQDIDSRKPVNAKIKLVMKDKIERELKAPCLLPELDTIQSIETMETNYYPIKLDFINNPRQLEDFRKQQTLYLRKAPVSEAYPLIISQVLTSMSESLHVSNSVNVWNWLLKFDTFEYTDMADIKSLVSLASSNDGHLDGRGTAIDDRLAILRDARSSNVDRLSNVKLFLSWVDDMRLNGGKSKWLGDVFIDKIQALIDDRSKGQ